jgi:hypothetical protein
MRLADSDISLLSEVPVVPPPPRDEKISDMPFGEDGPLLDMKDGGPLHTRLLLGDCRWSRGYGTDAVDGTGVDGFLGGDDAGVRNSGADVITSRNESSCRKESALCRVSRGLIGGTPPHPSIADTEAEFGIMSRRLGALEDPLMTAVLNRLLVEPPAPAPAIFLPTPIVIIGPNPNILK